MEPVKAGLISRSIQGPVCLQLSVLVRGGGGGAQSKIRDPEFRHHAECFGSFGDSRGSLEIMDEINGADRLERVMSR